MAIGDASKQALQVKKICVILTSSRSGSSLITKELSSHPDIASLGGEIDPFLTLSDNGFPYTSESDAIQSVQNREALLESIFNGLTVPSSELVNPETIRQRWYERFLIQFPVLFSETAQRERLLSKIDIAVSKATSMCLKGEYDINSLILREVFKEEPWRISYYDGYKDDSVSEHYFDEAASIGRTSFVAPSLLARRLEDRDVENKTFLFKATADAHRIGMYEELFPQCRNPIHPPYPWLCRDSEWAHGRMALADQDSFRTTWRR